MADGQARHSATACDAGVGDWSTEDTVRDQNLKSGWWFQTSLIFNPNVSKA